MKTISDAVTRLAFDLNENEPLTEEQVAICEEWTSGKAEDFLKVSIDDPRLLEYVGVYDRAEKNKKAIWNELLLKNA
jgi:transmembrane sensor